MIEKGKKMMLEDLKKIIYDINSDIDISCINMDTNLLDYLDSLGFIQVIVKIEDQYCIEFSDEDLDYERIGKISDLLNVVQKINNEEENSYEGNG